MVAERAAVAAGVARVAVTAAWKEVQCAGAVPRASLAALAWPAVAAEMALPGK